MSTDGCHIDIEKNKGRALLLFLIETNVNYVMILDEDLQIKKTDFLDSLTI